PRRVRGLCGRGDRLRGADDPSLAPPRRGGRPSTPASGRAPRGADVADPGRPRGPDGAVSTGAPRRRGDGASGRSVLPVPASTRGQGGRGPRVSRGWGSTGGPAAPRA